MVRLCVSRIRTRLNVRSKPGESSSDLQHSIEIAAHKLRRAFIRQADEIVKDKHLAITIRSGANSRSRDRYLPGYGFGDFPGHPLKHDGKHPGTVECNGIFQKIINL